MKGGYFNRFRGRQLSFIPIALILTTIFLWAWEKSPLVSTLLSAQEQFVMPSSEILISAHNNPSVSISQKEYNEKDILHSFVTEEASKKKMDQGFDQEQMKKDISPLFITEETSKGQKESGLDVEPLRSTVTSTTERKADGRDSMPLSSETKVCNYAKGRWVADTNRPLYSGFGCKRWLSEMWACRLTQRMDFSYEGFRWQPENCKMPEFEGAAFLERMQDKTVAFIGDSLGRQQFQSLMCMITGGAESPEVEDVGREYGLVKARGAIRPDGWAYRFQSTNTTVLYYWSATLCNLEPLNMTNPSTEYAMHLDRPAGFLRQYLHRFNVLVLNTGHHWNGGKLRANRWVMHVNGMLSEDKKLAEIGNAKNFTVHSVAKWLDSQLPLHPQLKAFFRTISPRHFVNGDWNTGGSCDNTIPLAGGSEVWQDGSNDPVIEGAVKGTKVKILDITAISQLRDEGHISRYTIRPTEGMQDCLHWCLPGIPDTWNELLYAQL